MRISISWKLYGYSQKEKIFYGLNERNDILWHSQNRKTGDYLSKLSVQTQPRCREKNMTQFNNTDDKLRPECCKTSCIKTHIIGQQHSYTLFDDNKKMIILILKDLPASGTNQQVISGM